MYSLIDLSKELFRYENGELYWKTPRTNRVKIGQLAGCLGVNGYHCIGLWSRPVKRCILVWAWRGLTVPDGCVLDHINGNRADDRVENLRIATRQQNSWNNGRRRNSTGIQGVRLRRDGKKWCARIMVNQKEIHLGSFDTEEQATAAYKKARQQYAGEFNRD